MARLKVSKLRYISPFFDQLSESSQLLWWFKSTWQKSIITRKPLHKLFKLFKSFNVCNVFKVFKTSWSKCSSGVGSGFEWCWKWFWVVLSGVGGGHLLSTTLPLSHCLEAAVPVQKLKHIPWLVQIMIIFIDYFKSISLSWSSPERQSWALGTRA